MFGMIQGGSPRILELDAGMKFLSIVIVYLVSSAKVIATDYYSSILANLHLNVCQFLGGFINCKSGCESSGLIKPKEYGPTIWYDPHCRCYL